MGAYHFDQTDCRPLRWTDKSGPEVPTGKGWNDPDQRCGLTTADPTGMSLTRVATPSANIVPGVLLCARGRLQPEQTAGHLPPGEWHQIPHPMIPSLDTVSHPPAGWHPSACLNTTVLNSTVASWTLKPVTFNHTPLVMTHCLWICCFEFIMFCSTFSYDFAFTPHSRGLCMGSTHFDTKWFIPRHAKSHIKLNGAIRPWSQYTIMGVPMPIWREPHWSDCNEHCRQNM